MYAAAFFESDPRKVVEAGLASIPAASPYGKLITDLLAWSKQYPDDWKKVWKLIEQKWDKNDPCPDGALKPFNIDAKLNGAYIALGLLYGKRDFGKTIEISTRAGQDSDCNPASAGGILGVMLGYDAIPHEWKGGIPEIANTKFEYTDFNFHTIVASTEKRALALIKQTGGEAEGGKLMVKVQAPKPPKLELWNYGTVAERVGVKDARWKLTGSWVTDPKRLMASQKGSTVEVSFTGTGAIVVGDYLPTGGKLDAYTDGKFDRTLDVNSDDKGSRGGESVYHIFELKPGRHTIKLVVRGEPYANNQGTDVAITDLVVFR
jgi:hypothetical protein